jgi:hypothetical protein
MCNIEIDVCSMFKIKYGLNKMYSTIYSHHVKCFNNKGVDIHPWGWESNFTNDIIMVNDGMLTVCTLNSLAI